MRLTLPSRLPPADPLRRPNAAMTNADPAAPSGDDNGDSGDDEDFYDDDDDDDDEVESDPMPFKCVVDEDPADCEFNMDNINLATRLHVIAQASHQATRDVASGLLTIINALDSLEITKQAKIPAKSVFQEWLEEFAPAPSPPANGSGVMPGSPDKDSKRRKASHSIY